MCKTVFSLALCSLFLVFSLQAQEEKDIDKSLRTAIKEMSLEDKKELLEYARYLHYDDGKEEFVDAIPTDETSKKIRAYSRYMIKQQETPEEKMKREAPATTSWSFDSQEFDFGTIKEGEKVSHVFTYENTGEEDLVIYKVKGSCGCTVPEWSKEPLKPGEKGEIKVTFDSKLKQGKQMKMVTILANTEPMEMVLFVKGKVDKE